MGKGVLLLCLVLTTACLAGQFNRTTVFPIGNGFASQPMIQAIFNEMILPTLRRKAVEKIQDRIYEQLEVEVKTRFGCNLYHEEALGSGLSLDYTVLGNQGWAKVTDFTASTVISTDAQLAFSGSLYVTVGVPVWAQYAVYVDYLIGHTCIDHNTCCSGGDVYIRGPVDFQGALQFSVNEPSGALELTLAPGFTSQSNVAIDFSEDCNLADGHFDFVANAIRSHIENMHLNQRINAALVEAVENAVAQQQSQMNFMLPTTYSPSPGILVHYKFTQVTSVPQQHLYAEIVGTFYYEAPRVHPPDVFWADPYNGASPASFPPTVFPPTDANGNVLMGAVRISSTCLQAALWAAQKNATFQQQAKTVLFQSNITFTSYFSVPLSEVTKEGLIFLELQNGNIYGTCTDSDNGATTVLTNMAVTGLDSNGTVYQTTDSAGVFGYYAQLHNLDNFANATFKIIKPDAMMPQQMVVSIAKKVLRRLMPQMNDVLMNHIIFLPAASRYFVWNPILTTVEQPIAGSPKHGYLEYATYCAPGEVPYPVGNSFKCAVHSPPPQTPTASPTTSPAPTLKPAENTTNGTTTPPTPQGPPWQPPPANVTTSIALVVTLLSSLPMSVFSGPATDMTVPETPGAVAITGTDTWNATAVTNKLVVLPRSDMCNCVTHEPTSSLFCFRPRWQATQSVSWVDSVDLFCDSQCEWCALYNYSSLRPQTAMAYCNHEGPPNGTINGTIPRNDTNGTGAPSPSPRVGPVANGTCLTAMISPAATTERLVSPCVVPTLDTVDMTLAPERSQPVRQVQVASLGLFAGAGCHPGKLIAQVTVKLLSLTTDAEVAAETPLPSTSFFMTSFPRNTSNATNATNASSTTPVPVTTSAPAPTSWFDRSADGAWLPLPQFEGLYMVATSVSASSLNVTLCYGYFRGCGSTMINITEATQVDSNATCGSESIDAIQALGPLSVAVISTTGVATCPLAVLPAPAGPRHPSSALPGDVAAAVVVTALLVLGISVLLWKRRPAVAKCFLVTKAAGDVATTAGREWGTILWWRIGTAPAWIESVVDSLPWQAVHWRHAVAFEREHTTIMSTCGAALFLVAVGWWWASPFGVVQSARRAGLPEAVKLDKADRYFDWWSSLAYQVCVACSFVCFIVSAGPSILRRATLSALDRVNPSLAFFIGSPTQWGLLRAWVISLSFCAIVTVLVVPGFMADCTTAVTIDDQQVGGGSSLINSPGNRADAERLLSVALCVETLPLIQYFRLCFGSAVPFGVLLGLTLRNFVVCSGTETSAWLSQTDNTEPICEKRRLRERNQAIMLQFLTSAILAPSTMLTCFSLFQAMGVQVSWLLLWLSHAALCGIAVLVPKVFASHARAGMAVTVLLLITNTSLALSLIFAYDLKFASNKYQFVVLHLCGLLLSATMSLSMTRIGWAEDVALEVFESGPVVSLPRRPDPDKSDAGPDTEVAEDADDLSAALLNTTPPLQNVDPVYEELSPEPSRNHLISALFGELPESDDDGHSRASSDGFIPAHGLRDCLSSGAASEGFKNYRRGAAQKPPLRSFFLTLGAAASCAMSYWASQQPDIREQLLNELRAQGIDVPPHPGHLIFDDGINAFQVALNYEGLILVVGTGCITVAAVCDWFNLHGTSTVLVGFGALSMSSSLFSVAVPNYVKASHLPEYLPKCGREFNDNVLRLAEAAAGAFFSAMIAERVVALMVSFPIAAIRAAILLAQQRRVSRRFSLVMVVAVALLAPLAIDMVLTLGTVVGKCDQAFLMWMAILAMAAPILVAVTPFLFGMVDWLCDARAPRRLLAFCYLWYLIFAGLVLTFGVFVVSPAYVRHWFENIRENYPTIFEVIAEFCIVNVTLMDYVLPLTKMTLPPKKLLPQPDRQQAEQSMASSALESATQTQNEDEAAARD